jgi:hypothetical protein
MLKISLAANVILGLLFLWQAHGRFGLADHSATVVPTLPTAAEIETSPPETIKSESLVAGSAGFQWKQLESPDYHLYVRNLRAIGCPEPTLRAIVEADVHAAYDIQIETLEEKISDLDKGSWATRLANYSSEQALRNEVLNLPTQEDAVIADLLGFKLTPVQVAAATTSAPRFHASQPPSMPLVFQTLDPNQFQLTAVQQQVIGQLQTQFLGEIGGPNQDTNDPAYLARWQQAQHQTDDALRGLLGSQFYLQLQLLAANHLASR